MVYRKIESRSNIWMPIIGQVIEGVIRERREGQFGLQVVIVQTDGKELVTPSHKQLQGQLQVVEEGSQVRITYLKNELPSIKGRAPTRIYLVEVDDGKAEEEEVK